MAEAYDYRQIINEKSEIKSISVAAMDGESSHEKAKESDSLLLCDYVKIRKVRKMKQKEKMTKADKKLKVQFNYSTRVMVYSHAFVGN